MRICVDTSVLIDILKDEYRDFQELLYIAIRANETLLVPTTVFAELMPQFDGNADLVRTFLKNHKIAVEPVALEAARAAADKWMQYLKRRPKAKCPNCGQRLPERAHVLSDFYIGGFALAHCDAILSRDRGIYKRYFSDLKDYGALLKSE